jgi:hypothetical protein
VGSERLQQLKERGIDEFRRFLLMFLYLWAVFGLFVLNERLVLTEREISFLPQGFAVINAAIMAKVMLIGEDLKFGRRFDRYPLIYPVFYRSVVFALLFIAFHVLERLLVGAFAGKTIVDSLPHIGGGTWPGRLLVLAIMTVSLLPFFMLRAIAQILGEGRLWALMFQERPPEDDRA